MSAPFVHIEVSPEPTGCRGWLGRWLRRAAYRVDGLTTIALRVDGSDPVPQSVGARAFRLGYEHAARLMLAHIELERSTVAADLVGAACGRNESGTGAAP